MRRISFFSARTAAAVFTVIAAIFIPVICVFAYSGNVFDEIGLLDDGQYENVRAYASEISAKTDWNIDVYITDCGIGDYDMLHAFCDGLYKKSHGYHDDGVLFLCDTEWFYICTFGRSADSMSERRADNIAKLGNDYYKTDPEKSIKLVLDGIYDYYAHGMAEDKANNTAILIFVGIIGSVIGVGITLLVIHHSYKMHAVPDTNMYLDHHTLKFDLRRDTFEREYVTRTTTSHSGGGGGGHHGSVGGGSHR